MSEHFLSMRAYLKALYKYRLPFLPFLFTTSGLKTEWDHSGRKRRDEQKKKTDKANKKKKKGKAKKSKR